MAGRKSVCFCEVIDRGWRSRAVLDWGVKDLLQRWLAVSDRTVATAELCETTSLIRQQMASKKRAAKKARKKAASNRQSEVASATRVVPFSVKFYGDDEFQRVKASAERAGLSLSAWARRVLEEVAGEELAGEQLPASIPRAIGVTEADREKVARGAAVAGVSGQPAWFRYILLAAASGSDGSVLLRQLQRAAEVGEEISKKD